MTATSRCTAVLALGLACVGLIAASCAHTPSPAEEGLAAGSVVASPDESVAANVSSDSVPTNAVAAESGPARRPEQRCTSLTGDNKIRRAAVVSVVDKGLGAWLGGVRVERVLNKGRFAGWRIGALHLANPCYAAVDLRPGDVVTAVNGHGPKKLERPDSAQAVFDSMRTASAIEVTYLRDGKEQSLKFSITDTVDDASAGERE